MDKVARKSSTPAGPEIVSVSPTTMQELGRAPILGVDQIQHALANARAAQPAWASLSFRERGRIILEAKRLLVEQQDEICGLIAHEAGKPAVEALTSEVLPVANLMDYFARKSAKILRDEQFTLSLFRNKKSRIQYIPLGVVGIVSPWNFPFSIPMGEVVMGLMAGNAVLLKPSEHATLVGLRIGELFRAAGLKDVRVRALDVPTDFKDFDDYWSPFLGGQGPAPSYAMSLDEERRAALRERIRAGLPFALDGSVPLVARAWAVLGGR